MKKPVPIISAAATWIALTTSGLADGPKDNIPTNVRPVPPPGIEVPAAVDEELNKGLSELKALIEDLKKTKGGSPRERDSPGPGGGSKNGNAQLPFPVADLLPDVEIYHKAVDWALRDKFFTNIKELATARELLAEGVTRAQSLKKGEAPWTRKKGRVVRAYQSRIDSSVQPYGLVIPESYNMDGGPAHRLDFWIHGRGETLSELAFLDQRHKTPGQFTPRDTIVLHLYGRYCCANKFAGEVDLFEALEHAKKFYRVDDNRIVVRGFSMGGAAAWQFGTHFAGLWSAVAPGAGFAETPEFLGGFQNEDVSGAPWYQKKLWHWYNSSDYALNLFNVPTIAYSGEIDKQKQAADVMEREMKKEGLNLLHIIGPQTAHKIHPDSAMEIERRLHDITAPGRNTMPREVHFTTWSLIYNKMNWVTIDAMGEQWERARVDASIAPAARPGYEMISVNASNVTALTLDFPAGRCPLSVGRASEVFMDGIIVGEVKPESDRSLVVHLVKNKGKWQMGREVDSIGGITVKQAGLSQEFDLPLKKRNNLCGPIDHAFMDSFLFVTPTGPALNPDVEKWVASELKHAITQWRSQFRGVAPQKKDTELKDEDIAGNNIVLWGDPGSNAVLKKIAGKLPIRWTADGIEVGGRKFAAGEHVPLLIYPNPLNPRRYVVVNSGFTYREYDYLNNARQVPKLPDWAIVNLSEPPNAVTPGKVADAGFFDESWKLKPVSK